jgi:hypothetical protein
VRFCALRACTVTAGSVSLTLARGAHRISFAGRLSRRKRLAPGPYTVAFSAASGGLQSRTSRLSFTITG